MTTISNDPREVLQNAVAKIGAHGVDDHEGTGWVYDATYLVTCWHVIENIAPKRGQTVEVRFDGQEPTTAEVVHLKRPSDVAILQGDFSHIASLPRLANAGSQKDGQWLTGFGYPLIGATQHEVNGTVTSHRPKRPAAGHPPCFTIQCETLRQPTNPGGWSGTPMMDTEGRIVGMARAVPTAGDSEREKYAAWGGCYVLPIDAVRSEIFQALDDARRPLHHRGDEGRARRPETVIITLARDGEGYRRTVHVPGRENPILPGTTVDAARADDPHATFRLLFGKDQGLDDLRKRLRNVQALPPGVDLAIDLRVVLEADELWTLPWHTTPRSMDGRRQRLTESGWTMLLDRVAPGQLVHDYEIRLPRTNLLLTSPGVGERYAGDFRLRANSFSQRLRSPTTHTTSLAAMRKALKQHHSVISLWLMTADDGSVRLSDGPESVKKICAELDRHDVDLLHIAVTGPLNREDRARLARCRAKCLVMATVPMESEEDLLHCTMRFWCSMVEEARPLTTNFLEDHRNHWSIAKTPFRSVSASVREVALEEVLAQYMLDRKPQRTNTRSVAQELLTDRSARLSLLVASGERPSRVDSFGKLLAYELDDPMRTPQKTDEIEVVFGFESGAESAYRRTRNLSSDDGLRVDLLKFIPRSLAAEDGGPFLILIEWPSIEAPIDDVVMSGLRSFLERLADECPERLRLLAVLPVRLPEDAELDLSREGPLREWRRATRNVADSKVSVEFLPPLSFPPKDEIEDFLDDFTGCPWDARDELSDLLGEACHGSFHTLTKLLEWAIQSDDWTQLLQALRQGKEPEGFVNEDENEEGQQY